MMTTMLIPFGDGMVTGRIEWPIDGVSLAATLIFVFALLLMGLLREHRPGKVVRRRPKGLRPTLSGRFPQHQAA